MELVPSSVALSFEVTYDSPTLDVGMTVFNTTSGSPVQVGSRIPMTLVYGNTYFAQFTPLENRSYVINKAVYTDDTLTTIDDNYSQGSESLFATVVGSSGSAVAIPDLVGTIVNSELVGHVEC